MNTCEYWENSFDLVSLVGLLLNVGNFKVEVCVFNKPTSNTLKKLSKPGLNRRVWLFGLRYFKTRRFSSKLYFFF